MINGEKSAFNNTVFGKRRRRTIEAILTSLYSTYEKDGSKPKQTSATSGLGDVLSDALTSGSTNAKRKEEIRKSEFLRIGQNLKLQTIIKGDAPTSQLTTGAVKNRLWEPKIFLQSFEHAITCSDSWNNCLVLATSNGVFLVDGKPYAFNLSNSYLQMHSILKRHYLGNSSKFLTKVFNCDKSTYANTTA